MSTARNLSGAFAFGAAVLLLLTGDLAAARAEPSVPTRNTPAGGDPPYAATLKPLLLQDLEATRTPGALVYVDDPTQGRWAAALGSRDLAGAPLDIRSHMRLGSVTKTFTATAVLQLADRGLIGLDRPIASYLPGIVPNGRAITVRQLLNMTSGLFNTTEDCRLNQALDRDPYRAFTVRQVLAFAFRHEPYFEPGEGWHYANTNYDVLGLLLEKVAGRELPAIFRHLIFEPLGMTGSALPPLRSVARLPRPHPRGYQFGTNVQSLNAYAALLRGDLEDAEIRVPPGARPHDATFWNLSYTWASGAATSTLADMAAWAEALATGALLSPGLQRQRLEFAPGSTYGLGIAEVLPGFLGHSGAVNGWQSTVGYSPDRGATIVVLANSEVGPNMPFLQALPADRLAATIQRTLFPVPEESPQGMPGAEPTAAQPEPGVPSPEAAAGQCR
jgi:D-alanyl-D-alanine carboxypeptidase